MDANLIYTKTPDGEEAVRQRTRVVQRNARMVLILVDGKSTVADLCEKTGNPQLVEAALQDLERDGLIAPRLEQDSLWDQSRKVAEEIKAAAVRRLAREEPEAPSPPAVPPPVRQTVSPEPFSIGAISVASPSRAPSASSIAPPSTFGGPSSLPPPAPQPPLPDAPTQEAASATAAPKLFARRDDEGIKPIRRGRSLPYISWPLAAALGGCGLLLLAALLFALYPYDRHRPAFEAGLAQIAGQTVRIGGVSASFSPRPAILLESVSIGESGRTQVAGIRLVPQFLSLLTSTPAFSSVEVDGATLDGDALAVLSRASATVTRGDGPARVGRLAFGRLRLSLLGLNVADLHGEFPGADADKPLLLVNADGSLRIQLQAEAGGVAADFEGYGWSPAAGSPYRFDSIQGRAVWDGRTLTIRGLDARIFDGALQGTMVLERGSQAALAADLTVRHMSVPRLATALGYANQFEGELAGSLRFAAQAAEWPEVVGAATGEGEFTVQRGALGGLDLVEAVRRAGKGSVTGGTTRYETLSGKLRITPQSIRFADLALASGALRAGGNLDVDREGRLSGRLDAEIRGSATSLRMPLIAGATLRSPELRAGR